MQGRDRERRLIGFGEGEPYRWWSYAYWFTYLGIVVCFILLLIGTNLARVLGVIVVALALRPTLRTFRMGAFASDDALVVRNLWRTYRIPWETISSVERATVGSPDALQVHTRSGSFYIMSTWRTAKWFRQPGRERHDLDAGLARIRTEVEAHQAMGAGGAR